MPKLNSCRGHSQVTRFTVSASTAHCTAHCARAHKTTKTKAAAEDVAAQQPSNCQRISKSKWNEVAAEAQPNEPKVKCELNECHDRKSSSTSSSGSRLRCQRERSLDREGESDCAVVQFFTTRAAVALRLRTVRTPIWIERAKNAYEPTNGSCLFVLIPCAD